MSLQLLSAAAFLYTEIALGCLLCVEYISNSRWQSIFTSRLLALIKRYGNFIFNAFVFFMLILFIESIHKTYKFSNIKFDNSLSNNPQAEVQAHMKLFRAQRNLYITGFSLFMLIVLKRLVTLISRQATLEASNTATLKQAKGASEAAKKLMEENEQLTKGKRKATNAQEEQKEDLVKEIENLKKELKEKEKKLESAEKNVTAMKQQSEGLAKEFNRIAEERNDLEGKLKRVTAMIDTGNNQNAESVSDSNKKDD